MVKGARLSRNPIIKMGIDRSKMVLEPAMVYIQCTMNEGEMTQPPLIRPRMIDCVRVSHAEIPVNQSFNCFGSSEWGTNCLLLADQRRGYDWLTHCCMDPRCLPIKHAIFTTIPVPGSGMPCI